MTALKHRTEILQFWVFFVPLSPLVFVSHNPPLWESGAWLTGLQNQIQGPPSFQTLSSQDPNSTFAKTTFSSILLAIQISWQLSVFEWSDKANAKVKVLRFWWEFPNWMFWELCHFPDPAPVTSDWWWIDRWLCWSLIDNSTYYSTSASDGLNDCFADQWTEISPLFGKLWFEGQLRVKKITAEFSSGIYTNLIPSMCI